MPATVKVPVLFFASAQVPPLLASVIVIAFPATDVEPTAQLVNPLASATAGVDGTV